MITFLAPLSRWTRALLGRPENTRGFHHDIHAQLAPGQIVRIALGQAGDGPLAHRDPVALHHGVQMGAAVIGIVLQQMKVGLRVEQVVHRHHLGRIAVPGVEGAEHLAAYTAESVDAYSDFIHDLSPRKPDTCRCFAARRPRAGPRADARSE